MPRDPNGRDLRPRLIQGPRAGRFSIPAQLQLLRGYATNRGVVVAKEFVDVETTKQAGRTGFGEMLTFLRKDKACRILLVEKTDRPRSWPAGMDCITPGARTPSRPRPSTRLCATGSTAATSTSMARGTSRASCGQEVQDRLSGRQSANRARSVTSSPSVT